MVYGGGDIVFGAIRSNQWMQWNSGIWWWGHCLWCNKVKSVDAVTQWMQWNSGIWWWGHCLWCNKVKPVDAIHSACSGIVVYGSEDIVFGVKRSNQWIQWMQSHSGHSTHWIQ